MGFLDSPFISEIVEASQDLTQTDWHERNAGNISLLLPAASVEPWLGDTKCESPRYELKQPIPEIAGYYLLISGSGKFMRRIVRDPADALALLYIARDGASWQLVWGLKNGGKPSSELHAHLAGHGARIRAQGGSRMLLHCHPPYTVALSFCIAADSGYFSRLLWSWHSESLAVFPEGVAILDLMLPGDTLLANTTAKALEKHRMVVWSRHGCIVAGEDIDECFGLVEVIEKTIKIAQIACTFSQSASGEGFSLFRPARFERISDSQLESLAKHYQIRPQYEF